IAGTPSNGCAKPKWPSLPHQPTSPQLRGRCRGRPRTSAGQSSRPAGRPPGRCRYDGRALVTRRTVLRRATLFAALSAFAAAGNGRAEDPRGDARAHYARGLELAGQNGYAGALQEFNAAYALSPQYAVLYNIGQAHVALGHTTEAIETLGRYLRDGGDRISPARRAQVERQIAWLRSEQPTTAPASATEAERA